MSGKRKRTEAKPTAKIDSTFISREQQLEIIFNISVDIISLISVEPGPRYRFRFVNKSFCLSTGLEREKVEGRYVEEIFAEASCKVLFAHYQQAIINRHDLQWEEVLDHQGHKKTNIIKVVPVFNDEGECTMLVSTVRVVTKRNEPEEETRVQHLLNERVKELKTLYSAYQILQAEAKPVETALQELVNILPAGWQYPEVTEARIVVGEKQYATPGFRAGLETQVENFLIAESEIGTIEVAYTEEMRREVEGPFLAEERNLIHMLAGMLSSYFDRNRVTEQFLKEKQLSESIINSLPGVFYLFDNTGKYLRWNKNLETIPGYTTEELQTLNPLDFFDEDEKGKITSSIDKVFKDGYVEVEANLMSKNGDKTPYWFNGISIEFEGKPCLLGVGIDITELKATEQELREAEIKFRTLVEKSQVGVYIVQKGMFAYVNPRFAEIFGYGPGELVNVDAVKTIVSDESMSIVKEKVRARMEGEIETAHYEVTGKKKDGTLNRVEFYGSRAMYEGQPTIIGTMVDITERKLAEEALQKTEANLRTIFDTTDTIYSLLDDNFQVISFNQRAFDFFKKELHRELKLNTDLVSYFPEKQRKEIYNTLKKVLAGEQVNYESNYKQKNGDVHCYHVRMFPISGNEGRGFGIMVAVSDITEKKLLEQKIMNQKVQEQKTMTRAVLNAQEKERNKIGQELHDNVNQILVGAKMYLGLIGNEKPVNEDLIKQSIKLIDNAIDEIRSLTWKEVTPPRKIGLKDIIQSLVENTNERSSVKTNFLYDTNSFNINNDLKLNIYRIIQEAINNVLKHANASNVLVVVEAANKDIHIIVKDDGKGFDPSVTKTKGVGIANMLNRVESYNGNLTIDSNPENGCKIEITIPI